MFSDQLRRNFLAELFANYCIHIWAGQLASLFDERCGVIGDRAVCLYPAFAGIGRQAFVENKPTKQTLNPRAGAA